MSDKWFHRIGLTLYYGGVFLLSAIFGIIPAILAIITALGLVMMVETNEQEM